jgi:signal transduction histidine kinase
MKTVHRQPPRTRPEGARRAVGGETRRSRSVKTTGRREREPGSIDGEVVRINGELQCQLTQRAAAEEELRKEHEHLRLLLELQDQQWRLIAYDIHDGLAQLLAGAQMQLRTFEQLQRMGPGRSREAFDEGMRLLDQGIVETRRLIGGLRPPALDDCGMAAAIQDLIDEAHSAGGPRIDFHNRLRALRLAPAVENAVFRIVQEALTNARRYSGSQRVRIDLGRHKSGHLHLEVQDWGIGFSPEQVEEDCFGLEGIRERAHALGGEAVVESQPGKGTLIRVELPIERRRTTS